MSARSKIIFHSAGHDFNPVFDQVQSVTKLLESGYRCHKAESLAALEHLGECDLLIFIGMYFTGWEGRYRSPGEVHRRALERYVAAGRPVIFAHGSIAGYDDWPRFAELMGMRFRAGQPTFSPVQSYTVRATDASHPLMAGIADFEVVDAIPLDIETSPSAVARELAHVNIGSQPVPVVIAAEGERVPGAGKLVFLGHGHDMTAFSTPQVQRLWRNAVEWCLAGR